MVESINAITPLAEARSILAENYDLKYTKAVSKVTSQVYERVKGHIPEVEWPVYAPLIVQINRMKQEKRALVLAHRYQSPPIYRGVADIVGDAMQLAQAATKARQHLIVQCGVLFMAEITKLLNPRKAVLIPDSRAGCSLAASITPEDVLAMKTQYPGVPVVAYINSPVAVKAVSDACCTASNVLEIVDGVEGDRVILLPDQHLARNVAKRTAKKIITWAGTCEVYDTFTATGIAELREAYPGAKLIAHPGCAPEVVATADFSGSTSAMIDWIKREKPARVVMVTECSASDNVEDQAPEVEFLRGCSTCPHMKRITLENILWSLHTMTEPVEIAEDIAAPARAALQRMSALESAAA